MDSILQNCNFLKIFLVKENRKYIRSLNNFKINVDKRIIEMKRYRESIQIDI